MLIRLGVALVVTLLCLWLRDRLGLVYRGAFDEINFHVPVIKAFLHQLPFPDIGDYLSATTPGYHYVLALIASSQGMAVVPFFNALVSGVFAGFFVALVAKAISNRREQGGVYAPTPRGLLLAFVFVLPLFASPYVLASAIWILPDNAAWLLVYLLMVYALAAASHRDMLYRGAVALLALVLVRQIHIWGAAPLIVAAYCPFYLQKDSTTGAVHPELIESPLTEFNNRYPRALLACLLTLPAFGVLAYFVYRWHGLTPPTFQGQYPIDPSKPILLRLFNAPASPAFLLALFGVFGIFYIGFWLPAFLDSLKSIVGRAFLLGFLLFALLVATVPATTYSMAQGRWSGLWNITQKFPVLADHTSILIVALALLGAVALWGCIAGLFVNHALVCLAAIGAFATAQGASFQLWQRYNEPFVLIMILLMLTTYFVRGKGFSQPKHPLAQLVVKLRFLGPAALGLALAFLSYSTFSKAEPANFFDLKPGEARTKAFLKGDPSIKPVESPH